MEAPKRMRGCGGSGDDDRRRNSSKLRPAEDHPQASDADVDEFFSIICRMRDATRSIAAARKAMVAPAPQRWTPAFALEDFVRPDAATAEADRGASAEGEDEEDHDAPPRCLDLNADPEPEVLVPENPCGEATSRCSRAPA